MISRLLTILFLLWAFLVCVLFLLTANMNDEALLWMVGIAIAPLVVLSMVARAAKWVVSGR